MVFQTVVNPRRPHNLQLKLGLKYAATGFVVSLSVFLHWHSGFARGAARTAFFLGRAASFCAPVKAYKPRHQ
jgi:hypothetical protein